MMLFSRHTPEGGSAYERRFDPEGARALAQRGWKIMLGAGLIVIIIAFSYSAWQFSAALAILDQSTQVQSSSASGSTPLDPSKLNAALSDFSARQNNLNTLEAAPASVADPSQ